ncbi:MAG: excinuclease ABC subunit UvrA [Bacteroidetes bacterium]|nr:excinuclease ABC subunit UvrA [Bacteroidota bacterium]
MENSEFIEVIGASEHNLKHVDISFPRNQLVVFTGLSGSGKSSLAFDTIFAEGQRRYLETFSAYARQFIGDMKRPQVDKIDGLSPVISIEQKTVSRNPRSTVGTITEIYDFLRLLYARAADAYSHLSGKKMVRFSEAQILQLINDQFSLKKITILAPVVKGRKGHYRELFEQIRKQGYRKVRVDGEIMEIETGLQLDRYKIHDIDVVIDRIEPSEANKNRINESIKTAFKMGKGTLSIMDNADNKVSFFSMFLMDPETGLSYDEPQPNTFSFNSPYGACSNCNGLGNVSEIAIENIIPDKKLSINKGGIVPIGELRENFTFAQLRGLAKKFKFSLADPIEKLSDQIIDIILHGSDESFPVTYTNYELKTQTVDTVFKGIIPIIEEQYYEGKSESLSKWAEEFMHSKECPVCHGARLKQEALNFKIDALNIAEIANLSISKLRDWLENIESKLQDRQKIIAAEIIKEIKTRVGFLCNVGLDYLTLNSPSNTLSGGEAQRIRLATQIGSKLVNVLYILDEPSIGLHQRDNEKLINSLKELRDIGNSVIVVEHDKDMIEQSDYIIDIGPKAGIHGGKITAHGTYKEFIQQNSLTAQYINGSKQIEVPKKRRKQGKDKLVLKGCTGHNLKQVQVEFPLGIFICVTGVSGSGKSSLINETLYPILAKHVYGSKYQCLPYKSVSGLEHIDKVIRIDQAPIGRTPRSNPATYTGVFSDIRNLYAMLPEAKIRGYKPGRFSFNVSGGRCETCKGGGYKIIQMNFLPDVEVLCDTCNGKRYNRETLEVRYKGKSINDVLDMPIEQAVEFFENMPNITRRLEALRDVGLGYITLGQSSTTLSGGEAQRVKLAEELSKKDTGKTFYILDEPTTGLHFEDIHVLLQVLNKLTDRGNTVLVIEHNMDVIKVADYIIDLGPEGGQGGGEILVTGTPEEIVKNKKSYTAKFLAKELNLKSQS